MEGPKLVDTPDQTEKESRGKVTFSKIKRSKTSLYTRNLTYIPCNAAMCLWRYVKYKSIQSEESDVRVWKERVRGNLG